MATTVTRSEDADHVHYDVSYDDGTTGTIDVLKLPDGSVEFTYHVVKPGDAWVELLEILDRDV